MSGAEPERPDELLLARVEYGRWSVAAVAGAAFATVLTLVAMQRADRSAEAALLLLSTSLPLLIQHVLVTGDPRRHYHVSRLMRLFTFAGLMLFVVGFAFFVAVASALAGWIWIGLVALVVLMLADSEIRGVRRRRARADGAG